MSGIAVAVDYCLNVDGIIELNSYDSSKIAKIRELVLWNYTRGNKAQITKFGAETWFSKGNKLSISFLNLEPKFDYQCKALVLGMYTQGTGEGSAPLSWGSIRRNISNLKRLACWLQKSGIHGFDEIDRMSELRFRNCIHAFIATIELEKHPSYAEALMTAIFWLRVYGVVKASFFYDILREYLLPYCSLKEKGRKRHAVIPTRILKETLSICEQRVESSIKIFKKWCRIQQNLNNSIPGCSKGTFTRDTYVHCNSKSEFVLLSEYHNEIKDLRKYAYILVLAYTGMRHGEVMELSDDAAFEKNEQFYIKSLLSKTTDGTQELEWITSEIAYKALQVLSNMARVYRERAELLLQFHGDKLPESRRLNLQFGLENKKLFNVCPHKQSVEFAIFTKRSENDFTNINNLFQIEVNEKDISQLESLNCNYQSISGNHKGYKKPYSVGDLFNFTPHQFRHTFAWFIIANKLGDLDDIKYQYKHLNSSMTLVYGQRGYETMEELIKLTEDFSDYMILQAVGEVAKSAEKGNIAGKGGQVFLERLQAILNDDFESSNAPHFGSMKELLEFTAKFTSNFRGLSHGYCTKGSDCKVKNAADPSHCVYCDSYIATPKHLPHWLIIRQRCEFQLKAFDSFPNEMKKRFASFSTALQDNLEAANVIIQQLTITVCEA